MSLAITRLMKGGVGFLGLVGGLYAGNILSNTIAGYTGNQSSKPQYRSVARLAITVLAAAFLPTSGKIGQYSEALVVGLMSSLGMGVIKQAFGVDITSLAGGDDYMAPSSYLLSGTPSFDVSSQMQLGEAWNIDELDSFAGVSDMAGISEF